MPWFPMLDPDLLQAFLGPFKTSSSSSPSLMLRQFVDPCFAGADRLRGSTVGSSSETDTGVAGDMGRERPDALSDIARDGDAAGAALVDRGLDRGAYRTDTNGGGGYQADGTAAAAAATGAGSLTSRQEGTGADAAGLGGIRLGSAGNADANQGDMARSEGAGNSERGQMLEQVLS